MMMQLGDNEVIFLLGAGASQDAGLPTSDQMLERLEGKLERSESWLEHAELYRFIKSSMVYGESIRGRPANINIENLVMVLGELQRKDDHMLSPFIGTWHHKLQEVAGAGFIGVSRLRARIVEQLRDWVLLDDPEKAAYLKVLQKFQRTLGFPLRVFTLNYDTTVERVCEGVETGFDLNGGFDSEKFEVEDESTVSILLHKMHGSYDWGRTPEGVLYRKDQRSDIPDKDVQMIFGTNYKLQYTEPFLFFAHELRRLSLAARVIICIGYSFSDEHINGILSQALRRSSPPSLISVQPAAEGKRQEIENRVASAFGVEHVPVAFEWKTAKEFMESTLSVSWANQFCKESPDPAF